MFDWPRSEIPVGIENVASICPDRIVSNSQLCERVLSAHCMPAEVRKEVEQRCESIESRTGLRERRYFRDDADPRSIGVDLLEKLVEIEEQWESIDAILVSSSSAQGFPGLSQAVVALARVRHPGLKRPFVLDVSSNACSSFLYAFTLAVSLINTFRFRRVACLAIEFSSRCIDFSPDSLQTTMLFGDAAAGLIVGANAKAIARLTAIDAASDITLESLPLITGSGVSARGACQRSAGQLPWYMAGPPVAVQVGRLLQRELEKFSPASVDWFIPHQANLTRIMIPAAERAGIELSRLCSTFEKYGNTSSAGIPLTLDELVRSGRCRPRDAILLFQFGASFTFAGVRLELTEASGMSSCYDS